MLDPLHSLHSLLRRLWAHKLAIRFASFLLSFGPSPITVSPTAVFMPGDSRYLACIKPPGKVGSDGFNFCRLLCTGLPQLLTSWALVKSLRCRFIAASLLSGPARFRDDTVLWRCALSPLKTSIGISVLEISVQRLAHPFRISFEEAAPRASREVPQRMFPWASIRNWPSGGGDSLTRPHEARIKYDYGRVGEG